MDVSDFFFLLGEGEGESEAPGAGRVDFFEIPRTGTGGRGVLQEREGPGRCL